MPEIELTEDEARARLMGRTPGGSLREPLPVPPPSLIGEASFEDVIAAVRLALLMRGMGSPDDCLDVIEELCEPHVPRDPSSTMPTRLLVDAVKLARPRSVTRRARPH